MSSKNSQRVLLRNTRHQFTPFLTKAVTGILSSEKRIKLALKPRIEILGCIDWHAPKPVVDLFHRMNPELIKKGEVRSGEYTLNSDTISIDFSTVPKKKIKSIRLPEMVDKYFADVGEYLVTVYRDTHHILGVEYWKYVTENPSGAPCLLKQSAGWQHLFGTTARDIYGERRILGGHWNNYEDEFIIGAATPLWWRWDRGDRVLLLEK